MGIILSVNIEYKEEETMDIIKKFGEMVGSTSLKDAKKARKLLLLGYQLQEKRLLLFPDKKLPYSGQYVARIVMQNIIKALSKPEDTAMVSIFVPGELLTAAVRAAIFKKNRGGRFSGDDVFVPPCIFGRIFDRAGSGAEMHGLYKSCL